MNYIDKYGIALLIAASFLLSRPATACNECHSKNPKMVSMHRELEFKDCFTCHFPGSKKNPEEQKVQMSSDERCVRCHKK